MTEIEKFHKALNLEVQTIQLSSINGDTREQVFTGICLDMLSGAHETENAVLSYDEKALGTKNQHKINGYAISDNDDTIDLFISIYKQSDNIETIDKASIDRAVKQITNFFTKAFFNNYEDEIAETAAIFDLSHTLAKSQHLRDNLIRTNVFILTNGLYKGEVPISEEIENRKIFFNVVDLSKLYSLSDRSRLPVKIDFDEYGIKVACMQVPVNSSEYTAYLTYLPGSFLGNLYEQYGFKLLEQNVRSFLQFRGKINQGIKKTVITNPEMFFAYNNGISATAESIELDETGQYIKNIGDLQIVNGGQTTATLYNVCKESKKQAHDVLVPVKISVISDKEHSYEIVKNISTYANTQNKVNDADLSANHPILVEIEKMSRYVMTPISTDTQMQHYWFFERVKKQYENISKNISTTKSRKKQFELKYPPKCKFTLYELAKYYNSYCEIFEDGKLVIGPNYVVDGNEPNFRAFRDHVLNNIKVDSVFYEDLIAKAILFKEVDKRHGTKRDKFAPIGDMKQVMVPYSIGLMKIATGGCLDLEKIWRNQKLSSELSDYMYALMVKLNQFLKDNSPKTNVIEWATKEECWLYVKENFDIPNINSIRHDLCDKQTLSLRYNRVEDENAELLSDKEELIKAIGLFNWNKIYEWGKDTGCIDLTDQNASINIARKLQFGYPFNKKEIERAYSIYEVICLSNFDLLHQTSDKDDIVQDSCFDAKTITSMLTWEKALLLLGNWQFKIIQNSLTQVNALTKFKIAELQLIKRIMVNNGFCDK